MASGGRLVNALATLILAVTLFAEAGYHTPDYAPILQVMQTRAERQGVPIETLASRYSAAWKRPLLKRRVMSEISNERFGEIVETVQAFARGKLRNPCKGRVDHWGDRHTDMQRALKAGWKRIDCGETKNLFWRVR